MRIAAIVTRREARAFFVSAEDNGRYALMLGPFDTHEEAQEQIDRARDAAYALNPAAHWWSWGTALAPRQCAAALNALLFDKEG